MTTYIPTATELEELGFEYHEGSKKWILYGDESKQITLLYYIHPDDTFPGYLSSFFVNNIDFYPRSLSDLKTLIQIFTPPN